MTHPLPAAEATVPYRGPEALREPITRALGRVADPEVALSILDVGLVYAVTVDDADVRVVMTMTSAACPVTDLIVDEVEAELAGAVPDGRDVRVELVWEPAWTPERISARGRAFMGW